MKRAALAIAITLAAFHCSTLAENAGGDSNLPSSGVGPFRKLAAAEVRGTAPYVYDDATANYREPCALALSTSGEDALYVVMVSETSSHDVIARTRSTDGRTFFGATTDVGDRPKQVLASDQSWESPDLAHPSIVAMSDGSILLYYTSNGSVGLAKSTDGLSFTKTDAPVLTIASAIASASVAVLPDGTFDMMFASGNAIYEATSADGTTWTAASDPVLAPSPNVEVPEGGVAIFDTDRVVDPFLAPRMTAANRLQVRVLYTGYANGVSAIGFAARYGTSGALTRADGAIYSTGKNESSPALYEYVVTSPEAGTFSGSLLYVEQDQSSSGKAYRAIAAGFAPANDTLPPPDQFPTSP